MSNLFVSDLIVIDGEPRIVDTTLASLLGFASPRQIRELIARNLAELKALSPIVVRCDAYKNRPFTEYRLDEAQALLLCMFSRTPNAAAVRKRLIEVFLSWRRNRDVPPIPAAHPDRVVPVAAYRRSLPRSSVDRWMDAALPHFASPLALARELVVFIQDAGSPLPDIVITPR